MLSLMTVFTLSLMLLPINHWMLRAVIALTGRTCRFMKVIIPMPRLGEFLRKGPLIPLRIRLPAWCLMLLVVQKSRVLMRSYMIRTTRRPNDGNLSRMLMDRIQFVLTAMVYFLMLPVEAQKMELMSAFIRQMAPRRKNGVSSALLNLLKTAPIVFLPLCRIKR